MVRETAATAIGVYENTNPTRLGEEQGGGCLAREGPRCCGRGEAAEDCVFTAEPLHPATLDSEPLFQGTGAAIAPEPKAPAGSTDNEHDYVVGCTESSPQGKVNRPTVVPEVLRIFYVAGGQGDKRRLPDHGDWKATPPDHGAAREQHT